MARKVSKSKARPESKAKPKATSKSKLKAKPEPRITNRIRALRFEHDEMTQQQLADRVGVTRQTINAIEASKYSPSLEAAFQIAAVFNLRVDEVFEWHA